MNKNLDFKVIKSKLIEFNKFLKNKRMSNTFFGEKFPELENILLNRNFTHTERKEVFGIFDKNVDQFQRYYAQFVNDREFECAKKLLVLKSGKLEIKDFEHIFLYPNTSTLREKDIAYAKISKKDTILFIGSGPIPRSAIVYNKYVGCRVDCFEQNKKYANISKKIIKKFGLSDGIKVYNRKGQSLGKHSYTLIVIALVAEPKDKILEKIKTSSSSDIKIMCKTSVGMYGLLFGTANPKLFDQFKIIGKICSSGVRIYYLTLMK